jgi:hypothetical protein
VLSGPYLLSKMSVPGCGVSFDRGTGSSGGGGVVGGWVFGAEVVGGFGSAARCARTRREGSVLSAVGPWDSRSARDWSFFRRR